ncbi:MAG: hypothetical protein LBP92_02730, partial [Deltaproteobacteria bacterium]|nr:hypothetical protein [Deltaproteobacteria bacterium]
MDPRNPFPGAQINEVHTMYSDFFQNMEAMTDDKESFINLDRLDRNFKEFNKNIESLDNSMLSYFFSNINEKEIIKQTKEEYRTYGINLRNNVRSSIKIQAERRKITITRSLLTPVSKEDRERLFQRDGCYGVYPLDRVIGLSALPFKMTVDAMLKVSKIAQQARSFRVASKDLDDYCGIKLDVCTISDVISHIGYIIFKHDLARSFEHSKSFYKKNCNLHLQNKEGVLYLQVDGAMIHTREKKDKDDSGWREHKLGMVYNSNDIKSIIRTNKRGKKEIQHKILKKEYTSYIGSASGFQKLFFESVCRNNYGQYKETVLISDGARWISNMKELLYPDATQILDFYHVSEKIWELGKLYFDNNSKKCEEWCTEICDKIEQSQYLDVKNEIIKKEKSVKNK